MGFALSLFLAVFIRLFLRPARYACSEDVRRCEATLYVRTVICCIPLLFEFYFIFLLLKSVYIYLSIYMYSRVFVCV